MATMHANDTPRWRSIAQSVAAVSLPVLGAGLAACVAIAVVLSACAPGSPPESTTEQPTSEHPTSEATPESSATGPIGPISDGTVALGPPGELLSTVEDVAFYPACGNEVLSYDGRSWFAFRPEDPALFPDVSGDAAAVALGFARMGVPRVAPPGPGDDVGTLSIYEGGFAYWVSENGEIETWLTTRPIEYMWVC